MKSSTTDSFLKLISYCENESFKGWDPYDGLNSKLFQATLLRKSPLARLILIQAMKRSPVNLRQLLRVPKEHNPKALGLFLTGYCNLYLLLQKDPGYFESSITLSQCEEKIHYLSDQLINMISPGYSGACWGYNFDWQNRVFFQPKYTPTIVVTSFCADALFNAYEITKERKYLTAALSARYFIEKDINRTKIADNQFIFSYSPLDYTKVYNASLLGARLLARCYSFLKEKDLKILSINATEAIINKQDDDGSWIYGEENVQNWKDSFHTGFNLECIYEVMQYTGDNKFIGPFEKGLEYYISNYFLIDGMPKYYHDKKYPIDIHSPAQLVAVLSKSNNIRKYKELVDRVLMWTIMNMQSEKGYFYYQLKRVISSKIPYMRWAQAWMFYAFSYYLNECNENLD